MSTPVQALLHRATARLQASSDSAALDARRLLCHALQVPESYLYTHADQPLAPSEAALFDALVERRSAGEPVAYLVGRCGFWSLELEVSPAVLIPRPDTETLVETALKHLPDRRQTVADLGTGSGAIALALATERPRWDICATDASTEALACAQANGRRLALTNMRFAAGHWFAPLRGERFDAIVSNPPYVDAADSHLAAPELGFEPRGALVAASRGLADLAQIARGAGAHLKPGGWLMLEHGYDQGKAVRKLLDSADYRSIETVADLAGRPRVTIGRIV